MLAVTEGSSIPEQKKQEDEGRRWWFFWGGGDVSGEKIPQQQTADFSYDVDGASSSINQRHVNVGQINHVPA